ncbi:fumarylacetoacetate hydrolase family protein [Comamonas antarctica]|uniref:fumarylacetoacetate hydrolase family protein n=1 Tax=Comamonas antarctica TaxID=2743470 RepID=UPI0028E45DA3|nr:fumarylacetoacetate hydrolase family protein [Comamonas antarctica]
MSVEAVTHTLLQARAQAELADALPLADSLSGPEQAYAVQEAVARQLDWFAEGVPRAWKSGGLARGAAMSHAPLPPAGVWPSPARAGGWPLHTRGIEAEIALRLGQEVSVAKAWQLAPGDCAGLVDAMAVSIEVVESRWLQQFAAPPLLLMADQLCHGALVLGEWQPCDLRHAAPDWTQQVCRMRIGNGEASVHTGTHSLADPAWLLSDWLRHATMQYGTLAAGTVVTTGSWVGLARAQAGDTVHVQFDGIGEAWLQL